MDPPEQLAQIALRALPALVASAYAAASAVVGAIPHTRRVALLDSLEGRSRDALERYLNRSESIESQWLVIRVLGVAGSAVLIYPVAPAPVPFWTLGIVLVVYAAVGQLLIGMSRRMPEKASPSVLGLLRPLELLAWPLAAPLTLLKRLASGSAGKPEREPSNSLTETEVEILVTEGELNGSLDHDQSEMIRNVLDFGDMQAGDVMLPRMQVSAIAVDTPPSKVLELVAEKGYSRYPVYRDRIDNVVGFLHVKDLVTRAALGHPDGVRIEEIMRTPVVYVPETQSASSVLTGMRAGHKHHIAIVIDEFGGMAGIITLEDIIERIVGDISDEHDPVKGPAIADLGDGTLSVDASVTVAELSRHLGVELPEDGDYYSLGGLIVEAFGEVPRPSAVLKRFGYQFTVREADARHIARVEVTPLEGAERERERNGVSSRSSRPRPAA